MGRPDQGHPVAVTSLRSQEIGTHAAGDVESRPRVLTEDGNRLRNLTRNGCDTCETDTEAVAGLAAADEISDLVCDSVAVADSVRNALSQTDVVEPAEVGGQRGR